MTDLVKYYSALVERMKIVIDIQNSWVCSEKTMYPKDKVYKKHMNYAIKTRTKELNRTIKKLEKLKALNKPFDPFDYCEGVTEELKQRILDSPTALEQVTRIAEKIHNSPFKTTHVWCVTSNAERNIVFTVSKKSRIHAACNRYLAYPQYGIMVAYLIKW